MGVLGYVSLEVRRTGLHHLVIYTSCRVETKFSSATMYEVHGFNRRYSVTQFLLPFIVLVYTYTRICVSIWTSNKMSGVVDLKKDNKFRFSQRNRDPFISKALINTVKQTIIVVTLYIVTSTPFIGCELWATWDPKAMTSPFFTGKYLVRTSANRSMSR